MGRLIISFLLYICNCILHRISVKASSEDPDRTPRSVSVLFAYYPKTGSRQERVYYFMHETSHSESKQTIGEPIGCVT